jgi:hypothetical protein
LPVLGCSPGSPVAGEADAAAAGEVAGLALKVAVTVDPGAGEAPSGAPAAPGAPGAAVGIPGGGGTFVAGAPGAPGAAGCIPVAGLLGATALGGGGGGGGFCAAGGGDCANEVSATSVRQSVISVFIFAAEVL